VANQMYPVILGQMGQVLGVSKKVLESDIKEIAEYWETCLEKASVEDRDTAIFLLTTCVTCYLRGRGIRLGNIRIVKKSNSLLVSFVTLIPLYAWRQPSGCYPKIQEIIPIEVVKVEPTTGKSDIISQAEQILRDKWE
jgi:hypothetical protein